MYLTSFVMLLKLYSLKLKPRLRMPHYSGRAGRAQDCNNKKTQGFPIQVKFTQKSAFFSFMTYESVDTWC